MSNTTSRRTDDVARRTTHLLLVTAPGVAGRAGQFAALVALALLVEPSTYGRFAVLQIVVIGTASVLGSSTAATVNGAAARVPGARELPLHALFWALLRGKRRVFLSGAVASALIVPTVFTLLSGAPPSSSGLLASALLGFLSGATPLGDALVAATSGRGQYLRGSVLDGARALVGAGGAVVGTVQFGAVGGGYGLIAADVLLVVGVLLRRAVAPTVPEVTILTLPRDGLLAGVVANVVGQVTQWILLFAVQLVGGPTALGVYGVANRFASVVTLAPISFGRTVIGQLTDDTAVERRWTARSFLGMITAISSVAAAVAFAVLLFGFPALTARYDDLVPLTVVLLSGTVARAVLIGVGHVCVARRLWRTWVVADVTSLIVTTVGVIVVWTVGAGVLWVTAVFLFSNIAGIAVRATSAFRPGSVDVTGAHR